MYSCKLAAILIAAIASSVHPQEIGDVDTHKKLHTAGTASGNASISDTPSAKAHSVWEDVCEQSNYEKCNPKNSTNNLISKENLGSSLIANIINGVLGIAAIIGLCLTRQLIGITSINGNRQLRAYVGWDTYHFALDTGITCIHIKNYGQTPAHDMISQIAVAGTEQSTDEILAMVFPDAHDVEVLFPGKVHGMLLLKNTCPPGKFICGLVTYRDEFMASHRTTFQVKVVEVAGKRHPGTCSKGNTAT
jgi:hypothetical protein